MSVPTSPRPSRFAAVRSAVQRALGRRKVSVGLATADRDLADEGREEQATADRRDAAAAARDNR